MRSRIASGTRSVVVLAILFASGAGSGVAQVKPLSHGMMTQHHGMADSAMMAGPHHLLAMAYRDNLTTFARVLERDITRSQEVNLELARPAVAEMRRSFEQMREHHEAQTGHMQAPMPAMMMDEMKAHLSALGESLTKLSEEVQGKEPDRTKVMESLAAILRHCESMMK